MSYVRYTLFYPDSRTLTLAGFGKVAHVPCVFDEKWRYARESSWYLRDRSKGLVDTSFNWSIEHLSNPRESLQYAAISGSRLLGFGRAGKPPTDASLETIGRRHVNFLEWCEWSRKHVLKGRIHAGEAAWTEVTYDDLIQAYGAQMLDGTWGSHSLAASTVNSRIDEACFFLNWAYAHSLRGAFFVDVHISRRPDRDAVNRHVSKNLVSRTQRVRSKPIDLRIPQPNEVDRWLRCVEIEKGFTKGLMCRLMKATGIRREECAQWRIGTLPERRDDWRISICERYVTVTLAHGAKGEKYRDEYGDLVGPSRLISMPIEIAEEIHRYREFMRPRSRAIYVKNARSREERQRRMSEPERRLFLSEYTGMPISSKVLYKAWTEVSYKPIDEWHPQLMRHYWAVTTLWEERLKAISFLKNRNDKVIVTGDWITGTAQSDIQTIICPQLGHVNSKTTRAYLVWLRQMHDASDQHDAWMSHIGGGDQCVEENTL